MRSRESGETGRRAGLRIRLVPKGALGVRLPPLAPPPGTARSDAVCRRGYALRWARIVGASAADVGTILLPEVRAFGPPVRGRLPGLRYDPRGDVPDLRHGPGGPRPCADRRGGAHVAVGKAAIGAPGGVLPGRRLHPLRIHATPARTAGVGSGVGPHPQAEALRRVPRLHPPREGQGRRAARARPAPAAQARRRVVRGSRPPARPRGVPQQPSRHTTSTRRRVVLPGSDGSAARIHA